MRAPNHTRHAQSGEAAHKEGGLFRRIKLSHGSEPSSLPVAHDTSEQEPAETIQPQPQQPILASRQFWMQERLLALLLLSLVFITYISSLPLTQAMLPRIKPTATSGATVAMNSGGECTATPDTIKYLPAKTASKVGGDTPLANGVLTEKDFANAQACAASFIVIYNTFDTLNEKSLEASRSLLTSGAQQRFQSNQRMNNDWRAAAQMQHLQQTAQASKPTLALMSESKSPLLLWMTLHCQIVIKENGQTLKQENDYIVLLVRKSLPTLGTGWQVSEWKNGMQPFEIPQQL